jgi:hypothetical protein
MRDVLNARADTQIYLFVFWANITTEGILLQKNEDRYITTHTPDPDQTHT